MSKVNGNPQLGFSDDKEIASLQRTLAGIIREHAQAINDAAAFPRSLAEASNATPTPSADAVDMHVITAQAEAAAFAAPTGSPTQGQRLIIRIKDNGTARGLTWNAIYRAMGSALPATTVLGKTLYLGFMYNATDTKWDLVALAQEA